MIKKELLSLKKEHINFFQIFLFKSKKIKVARRSKKKKQNIQPVMEFLANQAIIQQIKKRINPYFGFKKTVWKEECASASELMKF